jgi:hypothetical protein
VVGVLWRLLASRFGGFGNRDSQARGRKIDVRALGFAVSVSLVTALVFGVMPALSLARSDLHASLKSG